MRVVLDANVIVSALINPQGAPAQVFDTWRAERFQLLMSLAILEEIGRVLRYPKIAAYHRWSEERLRSWLEDLARLALMTPGILTLAVIQDDPPDNRYLECAVEGEAAYLVSGDRLLLSLGTFQGIQIVSPRVFLEVIQQDAGS
jgi:putative PIN family toxin of toxin-antitoxin system